jgi:hypothetical protein
MRVLGVLSFIPAPPAGILHLMSPGFPSDLRVAAGFVGRRAARLASSGRSTPAYPRPFPSREPEPAVSKKTKKRKLKARRNRANHGKKPNAGRRS